MHKVKLEHGQAALMNYPARVPVVVVTPNYKVYKDKAFSQELRLLACS